MGKSDSIKLIALQATAKGAHVTCAILGGPDVLRQIKTTLCKVNLKVLRIETEGPRFAGTLLWSPDRPGGGKESAGEWRIFGLGYQDLRDGVLKTDNRPAPVRTADTAHINIGTFGGHYVHTIETRAGQFDALAWVALQSGSWGNLNRRAGAFAAEAGWQPEFLAGLKPWFRGGYDYGSGDKNAGDSTHGTFFQVLPTPSVYARFPFFNMMNNRDVFGELQVRPSKKITVRSDVHSLRLANRNDLWYSGGGAFQPWTFGYTGRPSNGQSGLATLYDLSADYNVNGHVAVGTYYGYAAGKLVPQSIYPQGRNASLGFLELTFKF